MKKFWLLLLVGTLVLIPIAKHVQAQWFVFQNPLLGKEAKEFVLMDVAGKAQKMSELRGENAAVLFFWATWCPHCRTQLSEISQMAAEIKNKNIQLILIDLGEKANQVDSYLQKNNIQFPSLLDEQGEVAGFYGVQGIPTFVLVSSKGIVKAVEHELPEDYEELLVD